MEYDRRIKPSVGEKEILRVHGVLNHNKSVEEIRYAILEAGLITSSGTWILETEGAGFVRLRYDGLGRMLMMDVEFDARALQLKYVDASPALGCRNIIEGVCYKNHRKYYDYGAILLQAIVVSLDNLPD